MSYTDLSQSHPFSVSLADICVRAGAAVRLSFVPARSLLQLAAQANLIFLKLKVKLPEQNPAISTGKSVQLELGCRRGWVSHFVQDTRE